MLSILQNFASESGIHISLKAEKLFDVGPLAVTNSVLYGFICAIFIGVILWKAGRDIRLKAQRGFVQIVELIMEFIIGLLEGPFGSRKAAIKFAPYFGIYFLFIIFNNLLGLIPVVGPGIYLDVNGVHTPLFRPFTADLNGTIALSVIAILMVQILSVKEQGPKKHLQHYFTNKPWNPINFFIGVLEVLGELTRITSLALRLFLNTAVGEILVAVFTSMILAGGRTPFAVIPILLFEVLVAGIQAYVFTVLSATYLGLAISHAHEDHSPEHPRADAKVEHAVDRGGTIHGVPLEKAG